MHCKICPFLVLILIGAADPLNCYLCSSAEFEGCADPFDYDELSKEVSFCDPLRNGGLNSLCVKEVFSFSYYATGDELRPNLYIRKCMLDTNNDLEPGTCPMFFVHDIDHNVTMVNCILCNYDQCNSARRNSRTILFPILFLLHTYLIFIEKI